MGKSWHSDHFVCCVAGCKFEDGKFFAKVSNSVYRGRVLLYGCVCVCVCVCVCARSRLRVCACVHVDMCVCNLRTMTVGKALDRTVSGITWMCLCQR